jgi:hypothetical protein
MNDVAWQVFKMDDGDPQDPIDDRDPCSLSYVGRIVKPEDAGSYWAPDEEIVGRRFGAGMFLLFDDDSIVNWTTAAEYARREPLFLDVVAETRYAARKAVTF